MSRYEVRVEEGLDHGDLFELERTTWHRVVDVQSGEVVLTFEEQMSATLGRGSGMWEGYEYAGVREVRIAEDARSVWVSHHDGREERVSIPTSPADARRERVP